MRWFADEKKDVDIVALDPGLLQEEGGTASDGMGGPSDALRRRLRLQMVCR